MKELFKLGIFLLILGTAFGPSLSQAFNSATHIYIAEQVFPFTFDKINLYYGSIASDIPLYANLTKWPYGFCETHYKFIKLPYAWCNISQRAFAQGWQTHNEIWGADFYAHGTCGSFDNCCDMYCGYQFGYVNIQANTLLNNFEILKNIPQGFELAHFAIEVAIDLLLIDYYDHDLGKKLLKAALFRSPADLKLLTMVFIGQPNELGTDLETLSSAESTFRNLVIRYAFALTLSDPLRMAVLGELGIEIAKEMGVQIDSTTVQEILKTAMYLCEGTYYVSIQSAINEIKKRFDLIK